MPWRATLLACAGLAFVAWPPAESTPAPSAPRCSPGAAADHASTELGGPVVRVAYVVPADGSDRLEKLAPTIRRDADRIATWWQEQDPTRTVRFAIAQGGCGLQVEIRSLRLRDPGGRLAEPGVGAKTIADALPSIDSRAAYVKFLVYYDGPVSDRGTCGEAGNPSDGPGFAIVLVRACDSVDRAATAAHELIHTLGAVHPAAPHTCAFPDGSHTCDHGRDVMSPADDGSTLARLLLDAGRDDYYGHARRWADVRASGWLVRLDRQVPLTVTIAGGGSVESDVPGIACAAECTSSWNAGARVTLTPEPAAGMRFRNWNGACLGGKPACTVSMRASAGVRAVFVRLAGR